MKNVKRGFSLIIAITVLLLSCSGVFSAITADAASSGWVGSWSTSPVHSAISLGAANFPDLIPANSTVRTVIKLTKGGTKVRFKFSNKYGSATMTINEATVAQTASESSVVVGTVHQLTFNGGLTYVNIDAGSSVWSDPVSMKVTAFESLSISTYYNALTYMTTSGLCGAKTYMSVGSIATPSQTGYETLSSPKVVDITSNTITYDTTPFLCNCDVYSSGDDPYSVVVIGDSTLANDIPEMLAQRLYANGAKNVGVLQQAIVGNRLLYNGSGILASLYGDALIDRFEDDALDQTGVKIILVKIGLNDIIHPMCKSLKGLAPYSSDDEIIAGFQKLADMAHARGIKIYFFTKSPWKGYTRNFLLAGNDVEWTQEAEDRTEALDNWVMSTNSIDGYIDVYNLRDPYDLPKYLDSFTVDYCHPNTLAQIAMVDDIPMSIFGLSSAKSYASICGTDPFAGLSAIAQRGVAQLTTEAPVTAAPTTSGGSSGGDSGGQADQGGETQAVSHDADGNSIVTYSYAYVVTGNGTTAIVTGTAAAVVDASGITLQTAAPTNAACEAVTTVANVQDVNTTSQKAVDRKMSTGTKIGICVAVLLTGGVAAFGIVMSKKREKDIIENS